MYSLGKWKLHEIYNIVIQCEDIISRIAEINKAEQSYEYLYLLTYAKAILNIKEVLCLLTNGYPDGALARARNIYEQMILINFISKHRTDTDASDILERYFDDIDIQINKNRKILYETLLKMDNIKNKSQYIDLINKINLEIEKKKQKYFDIKSFKPYWWASKIIKNPNFDALQNDCDPSLFKVLYKRACISTHAGAVGDITLLGRDNPYGNVLTTCETFEGFELPILLSMDSFELLTDIIFDYFHLKNEYSSKLMEMCQDFRKHLFC